MWNQFMTLFHRPEINFLCWFVVAAIVLIIVSYCVESISERRSLFKNISEQQAHANECIDAKVKIVEKVLSYINNDTSTRADALNKFVSMSRSSVYVDTSHKDVIDFDSDDSEQKLVALGESTLPPYIDSEGNIYARYGQVRTDHGVLYHHPLTGRPMLLDLQGVEHDVLESMHDTPYIWRAVATQGSGSFSTPPLKRQDAMDYVCKSGNVQIVYVDDNIKSIMFKQI